MNKPYELSLTICNTLLIMGIMVGFVQAWDSHPMMKHKLRLNGKYKREIVFPTSSLNASSDSIREKLELNDILPMSDNLEHMKTTNTFPLEFSKTISFPPYPILSSLKEGEGAISDEISVRVPCSNGNIVEHKFLVLCYPKGGGHGVNIRQTLPFLDGFDEIFMTDTAKEKKRNVGIYLKYIPPNVDSCLDVTFCLRLRGKQGGGSQKFDVAWESGMRFVSPEYSNLKVGLASDFGSSIMQKQLLPSFLGVDDKQASDGILEVEVKLTVHKSHSFQYLQKMEKGKGLALIPKDIRIPESVNNEHIEDSKHNTKQVRVGKIIVPVLKSISQRQRMFSLGCYPGVEYRVMRILDSTGKEIFGSEPGADYEIKPIYPLVQQLEREWPVRVNEKELPLILNQSMYNFVSAIGSLFTAITGLATAFAISLAISFYFIPSKSMEPNLKVGDVLLVEKVSNKVTKGTFLTEGDVVLFPPPSRLQDIIISNGGSRIDDRDLFVKRVAATAGDIVQVEQSGRVKINGVESPGNRHLCDTEPLKLIEKYINPREFKVPDEDIFVMGDCSDVSIDSRVWGALERQDVIGRPLLRVWPLDRFGRIPDLPTN